MKAVKTHEAAKYVAKCDKTQQPLLYLRIGAYGDAAQQAFSLKDSQMLE